MLRRSAIPAAIPIVEDTRSRAATQPRAAIQLRPDPIRPRLDPIRRRRAAIQLRRGPTRLRLAPIPRLAVATRPHHVRTPHQVIVRVAAVAIVVVAEPVMLAVAAEAIAAAAARTAITDFLPLTIFLNNESLRTPRALFILNTRCLAPRTTPQLLLVFRVISCSRTGADSGSFPSGN